MSASSLRSALDPYRRASRSPWVMQKNVAEYAVLVDGPSGREQKQEPQQSSAPPGRSVMATAVCTGLAVQGSAFVMLRSYLFSNMCDSQVLAWSEVIKLFVSLAMLNWHEWQLLRDQWLVALPPVVAYGVMNLLSFWCMKRLPAMVSIVLVQLKLVFTALCSRASGSSRSQVPCRVGLKAVQSKGLLPSFSSSWRMDCT